MVDTLVSGASASRHVGSSPILGTKKEQTLVLLFFYARWATIFTFPPNLPLTKGGYKLLLINTIHLTAKNLALFLCPLGNNIYIPSKPPFGKGRL